ncbi:3-deoxy-D-manno-octulosonic acid kinase [Halomonas sp. TRM85114]|uniref:3-deoxy-D-manno-octulosonic acid kinase n=1 Tax=Halomonas jincaotanensis TaxID=2810616 RepID=UPI001BD4AD2B|nr:3-deoxy-D-manno-octulosonic acid kinase [Halomonas jincaotanensis]MBS9403387.1 3-deoxy-D-manno-octulosonic acid kinase [Halomonas jincaotanensis]
MHLATCRTGRSFILYEASALCDALTTPPTDPRFFDPDHWRHSGQVIGEAPGRGASLFLNVGKAQWVLRPYRRGGLIARLSERRYLWTGLERTRAFREMRLTAELYERGLPVPRPLAAGVTLHGPTYEAALITIRIAGARALAELLLSGEADAVLLERVGATVRRFHDAGLDHVDLNARNLLVDPQGKVWLIDLDRCRQRQPGKWREANLERLQRSLGKFDAAESMPAIRQGYSGARG